MKNDDKILFWTNIILVINTVIFAIYIIGFKVLYHYGLQYRASVNAICILGALLIYAAGFCIKCIITRNMRIYIAIAAVAVCVSIMSLAVFGLQTAFFIESFIHGEYVVEIDGYKFVGYKTDVLDVFIDCYDYKNVFVAGNTKRFTAFGAKTDANGNYVLYDDFRDLIHLEDIEDMNWKDLEKLN